MRVTYAEQHGGMVCEAGWMLAILKIIYLRLTHIALPERQRFTPIVFNKTPIKKYLNIELP
jgi:hypothetical protein